MLSQEDNELLCRVGPGTPMGNFMRQYWVPALRADELPAPDCPPVRVRLLGENLIAFRMTSGKVGLMQNACPHRGASMFFGRNEEEGLRCVYHGWKFDATGSCVDMPSEPAESNFKSKVHATAYPCVERGQIVWTYMGPRAAPPPLPDLEANLLPSHMYTLSTLMQECNWLQALEGDFDTVHTQFLHSRLNTNPAPGTGGYYSQRQKYARFHVIDTDYGVTYGCYREAEEDSYYWRVAHFLFPFYTMVPTGNLGIQIKVQTWVPMDDEHTLYFQMRDVLSSSESQKTSTYEMSLEERARKQAVIAGARMGATPHMPNSTDWFGRFRNVANASNDYMLNREEQRTVDYAGMPSDATTEDQAMIESMGSIMNRGREHLGTSDAGIVRMRRALLRAVKALRDEGVTPPGVDQPEVYRQRSGYILLPTGGRQQGSSGSVSKRRLPPRSLPQFRPEAEDPSVPATRGTSGRMPATRPVLCGSPHPTRGFGPREGPPAGRKAGRAAATPRAGPA
jgi:phthalate 4,5-dioxygenase oxygenase subunit